MKTVRLPSRSKFVQGVARFHSGEPRDSMYRIAKRLLREDWGKPAKMADDIGVLLLTWNQAFYRYGVFDFDRLAGALKRHMRELTSLRRRRILSLDQRDERLVRRLFKVFLKALRIYEGKRRDSTTPVGTAKALHLLAPNFFPLWDQYIASGYGCRYSGDPTRAYIRFCFLMQNFVRHVGHYRPPLSARLKRNLLKRTDEYNYAKFTM